ncbi:MAG: hypothetical protein M3X11_06920, partial [Acidobacteriota bacterium]|nr:hypothetical protein [Acidobacteriota bacterium]
MKSNSAKTKLFLTWLFVTGAVLMAYFVTPVVTALHGRATASNQLSATAAADRPSQAAVATRRKDQRLPIIANTAANVTRAVLNNTAQQKALQGMPLAFIENRGQADARAAF